MMRPMTGDFATADDVAAAGLRLSKEQRVRAEIRAKVAKGFAKVDQGKGLDGRAASHNLLSGLNAMPSQGR